MKSSKLLRLSLITVVTLLITAFLAAMAQAASVSMNASDGLGQSSYNTGVHWTGGQAPVSTNDYFTAGFFIRTPGDGTTNDVFAGASLTLNAQNTVGGNNGSFLEKFSGGAGSTRWLTINNFTNNANSLV